MIEASLKDNTNILTSRVAPDINVSNPAWEESVFGTMHLMKLTASTMMSLSAQFSASLVTSPFASFDETYRTVMNFVFFSST